MIRRLQPELAQVAGITLFMQPVQDLTVEDRVSRTQFQYTLEDPNADELNTYAPQMVAKLQAMPELRDVATRSADAAACARSWCSTATRRRAWASRRRTIDQTLYDAYGQRQVSTMFTQLNQYHVVLEVKPGFQKDPMDLRNLFIRAGGGDSAGGSGVVSGGSTADGAVSDRPARRWQRANAGQARQRRPACVERGSFVAGVLRQRQSGAARALSPTWK